MADENTTYYDYSEEYTDELCRKDDVVKIGCIIIPVFFTAVVVLSCIGNTLVLVILVRYKNLKSLTNVFILNLVLSNLLFTFGLPFWASYYVWGWTFGEVGCKVVKFFFYMGFYSSVLFLTIMTIQRYMAVVHPLSDWGKSRCFSVAPFIIWILSGAVALLGSFKSKVLKESNNEYCEYSTIEFKSGIAYFQNALFFLAFLIMGFCYGRMLQTTRKTVKVTFLIALVFFIGWAPYNIAMFLKSLTDQQIKPFTDCTVSIRVEYAYYVCRMLAFTHCCINPAFINFVDTRFCKNLQALPKRVLHKDLGL